MGRSSVASATHSFVGCFMTCYPRRVFRHGIVTPHPSAARRRYGADSAWSAQNAGNAATASSSKLPPCAVRPGPPGCQQRRAWCTRTRVPCHRTCVPAAMASCNGCTAVTVTGAVVRSVSGRWQLRHGWSSTHSGAHALRATWQAARGVAPKSSTCTADAARVPAARSVSDKRRALRHAPRAHLS